MTSEPERDRTALLCTFSFVAGIIIATAFLWRGSSTPDYVRGHEDGYRDGWHDAGETMKNEFPTFHD